MVPINRMVPRSFITNIKAVDISVDGGTSWRPTTLGNDKGKYSFRQWQIEIAPPRVGHGPLHQQRRPRAAQDDNWNPSGFMHNGIETLHMTAA